MENKKIKILSITIIIFFICAIGLYNHSTTIEPISKTNIFFDTVITIKLYDCDDEALLDEALSLCEVYEEMWSRTIDTSEISQINNANGAPVTVSDETIELLEIGLYYSELSEGAFDLTIAPLSILWDFGTNTTVPDEEDIETAKAQVDYHQIVIEGNEVYLTSPDAMIDVGAIAKGYIADLIKEFLIENGVESALINLGGNVLAIGDNVDDTDFQIGIKEPFDDTGSYITSVSINDQSVVTSGIYERYFEVDDVLYHHILDPDTGYPYDNDLIAVTIISEKSVDGDALSTTCYALGLEKGMELIESLEGIEAIFVTQDMNLHYSFSQE